MSKECIVKEEGESVTLNMPYVEKSGNLIIPFDSNPKYHWWNAGQSASETIEELNMPLNKTTK